MKEEFFTKLPNLLLVPGADELSMYQEIRDDKIILVLDFLINNMTTRGNVNFTLEYMVCECGYKPNKNKGKSNELFKCILSYLQMRKVVICNKDLSIIKANEFVTCGLDVYSKDREGNDIKFFQLYDNEKFKILSLKKEGINNVVLLKMFCYLKTRMYRRKDNAAIEVLGGKAQCCYPSYKKIEEDINISEGAIKKYIDTLVELDLIRYDNAGLYKDKIQNVIKESNNTYVLYDGNGVWKTELKEAIKMYKAQMEERECEFSNSKKYRNNNRKENGSKGGKISTMMRGVEISF